MRPELSALEPISTPELEAILRGDIAPLSQVTRDSLLDLILAWADLDGSTAFLAANLGGLNPSEGADKYGRKVIEHKLKVAARELDRMGDTVFAAIIADASKGYAERALIRRRIAHSRCAGIRQSDPSRIVFMPYESEGDGLAVEIYSLEKVKEQTEWARQLHSAIMQFLEGKGFFSQSPAM